MKKIYFILLALSLFSSVNAQIINFPDANFKAYLLDHTSADRNNDQEIDQAEAADCYDSILPTNSNIQSLEGIQYFINISGLDCSNNQLTSLDVSNLSRITYLKCYNNQITSLNVSGLNSLIHIECSNNLLTSLSLSNLPRLSVLEAGYNSIVSFSINDMPLLDTIDLKYNQLTNATIFNCSRLWTLNLKDNFISSLNLMNFPRLSDLNVGNNQLTTLDISSCPDLGALYCFGNPFLESLFLKNGKRNKAYTIHANSNLRYICVDEADVNDVQTIVQGLGYTCQVNSYCSFTPGGQFYVAQGNAKYDIDNNGYNASDIDFPRLRFSIASGSATGSLISNDLGNYYIPVLAGTHTITPVLENPAYYTVSPASVNVTFPAQASPLTQNFCITANGTHPDLEVSVLPIGPARPGFDSEYVIIYKNKGNTTQSGNVSLTFNDGVLDFVTANPAATVVPNNLSWSFTNLPPFETREITFTMNVNSPMETPAVNNGDILTYTATISSPAIDDLPNDNTATFNQTVVNSYDPNDKTCLEGTKITPDKVGEYVHYMIRFENTGTFPAQNIVVKDMIDTAKFDINSLVPMKGSHSFVTNITSGNKVEFIFENINLPFDDANNDGYVMFKIKTKPTLVLGNTFSNTASIYFDYNFPIVTNTATTTIATLSNPDFEFSNYFKLYPNPVHDTFNIITKETIEISSVSIYNTMGQLVMVIPNADQVKTIDVSNLTTGHYFIKINSDKGTSNTKFIKN